MGRPLDKYPTTQYHETALPLNQDAQRSLQAMDLSSRQQARRLPE